MLVSVLFVVTTVTFLAIVSNNERYTLTPKPSAHLRKSTDVDSHFGKVS